MSGCGLTGTTDDEWEAEPGSLFQHDECVNHRCCCKEDYEDDGGGKTRDVMPQDVAILRLQSRHSLLLGA
jgi:hypothetical protein